MGTELLEIQPRELKFTFELRKQSSCSVQLVNNTTEYVAFKVKTTSPKRYCVRPNTGIVVPKSTCDFTVTLQAQKVAPPDMQLKDKFLVQSTVVPSGSTEEDITPNLFSKENNRVVEENKLKVVLVSPPHSPVLQPINPINGALKQDPAYEASISKESTILKDAPILNDQVSSGVEIVHPSHVAKDVNDLKLQVNNYELKVNEAEKTITGLREEKSATIQERDKLQREVVLLIRKCDARVQVGFPFLFVCFVALVGIALGYLLHP